MSSPRTRKQRQKTRSMESADSGDSVHAKPTAKHKKKKNKSSDTSISAIVDQVLAIIGVDKSSELFTSGIVDQVTVIICAGFVFGYSLEKSKAFEPTSIRDQMLLRQFTMLKTFMAAMATSMLCFAAMMLVPSTRARVEKSIGSRCKTYTKKGLLTSTVGPCMMGIGMTLAAACPGTVFAQVGAGTVNALYTLLGCILGAMVFGMVAPTVNEVVAPKKGFKHQTLDKSLGVKYTSLAFPLGLCFLGAALLLEMVFPWKDLSMQDNNVMNSWKASILQLWAWTPNIAGIVIGCMQVPIMMAVGSTLGTSSSAVVVASQWVNGDTLEKKFPYLAERKAGFGNTWQVLLVCAIIFGSLFSAHYSGSVGSSRGVPIPAAILGGAVMLFGGRLACGCSIGHGISGAALLFYVSWISIPSMMIGGMSTAVVMNAMGQLDNYVME